MAQHDEIEKDQYLKIENLFGIVRIRNVGASLGFEKIIIKNGMLIMFFVSNKMSPYYQSDTFASVLERTASLPELNLKQSEGKLKIVTRGVESVGQALGILNKLQ